MVDYLSHSLDQSFYALSDPTRRALLRRIAQGEVSVGELAEPFDMSLAAVSKHLQVLERANFVTKTKQGRTITCKANLAPLSEVMELLEDLGVYWNTQLDSLEKFLGSKQSNKEKSSHERKQKSSPHASRPPRRTGKKR